MEFNCSVVGCTREIDLVKQALCYGHYQQKRNGKPFGHLPPIVNVTRCPVNDCARRAKTRGLCPSHASIAWRMSIPPVELVALLNHPWCYICNASVSSITIDHDHSCCPGNGSCGACVRGTLCHGHNTSVGNFEKKHRQTEELREKCRKYLEDSPHIGPFVWQPATVDTHPGRRKSSK